MNIIQGVALCVLLCSTIEGHTAQLAPSTIACKTIGKKHGQIEGDLVQVLVYLEHQYSCAMFVELYEPFPVHVLLAPGTSSLEESLRTIVARNKKYAWKDENGVIVFYEAKKVSIESNPLNQVITEFEMPETLSDLKRSLPSAISSASTHTGGLLNGLGVAPSSDAPLKQIVLRNTTARNVILEAIRGLGHGFSLLLFGQPKSEGRFMYNLSDWILVAGKDLDTFQVSSGGSSR